VVERQASSFDALALQRAIDELDLQPGESVRLTGQAHEVARSFRQLGLALALSLALVFLTLAAIYESVLLPWVIMACVPTAAGGGILLLGLTGQSLTVISLLGLILLGGIVVNNAIVLMHRIEQARRRGAMCQEAIQIAMRERYRPILMTTLTTLLGMLPLALLGGDGVELRRALSITVIGGMLSGTLASLMLVPALYLLVDRFRPTRAVAAER